MCFHNLKNVIFVKQSSIEAFVKKHLQKVFLPVKYNQKINKNFKPK